MASTYNPYNEVKSIYDAKVGWNNSTTDEERKKYNDIANKARQTLEAYGYGDVANQMSANGADATAARKIMEQYAPKPTTAPVETNNLKSNEVNRENAGLFDKYNQSYEDIKNTNPFKTDEAKAILGKYDLAGLQARDNAVASGGASNGGNIDSYASANAMRQQSALISQGQSAVLDAHQQKIDNIRGILSDMGVNIDRVFNQDETAKNNNVARLSEQANVTGYVPNEWIIKNDDIYSQFLNEDGSFKTEQEGVDIQALINQAKASGDTETAKKLAVVRTRKILGNYGKFGQYSNMGDIASMTPQQTEAGRVADMNDATVRESLKSEKEINAANNQNEINKIQAETQGQKEILQYSTLLEQASQGKLTDEGKKEIADDLNNVFKPYYENGVVSKIGNKFVINGDYGGAIVRYLYKNLLDQDPEATATLMEQMFGIPRADTQRALSTQDRTDAQYWQEDYR